MARSPRETAGKVAALLSTLSHSNHLYFWRFWRENIKKSGLQALMCSTSRSHNVTTAHTLTHRPTTFASFSVIERERRSCEGYLCTIRLLSWISHFIELRSLSRSLLKSFFYSQSRFILKSRYALPFSYLPFSF